MTTLIGSKPDETTSNNDEGKVISHLVLTRRFGVDEDGALKKGEVKARAGSFQRGGYQESSAGMEILWKISIPEEEKERSSGALETTTNATENILLKEKKVQFSTLERRLYPLAPDDNPSVSGFGAALAFGGWNYEPEPPEAIDEYEKHRLPQRRNDSLKLSRMERYDRLKEFGASSREIRLYANRVRQLKIQRAQTVEAIAIHGKGHMVREEKLERAKRWVQRLLGIRKSTFREQAALWEQAQSK